MHLILYYQRKWLLTFEDMPSEYELMKRRWIDPEELARKELAFKVKYPLREALKTKAWPNFE